jgi:hypothetical protein
MEIWRRYIESGASGELERTMLESFCTTAHIKVLQEPGAPDVLNKAADILQ